MTTATCEHLTKEQIASEQERVRHNLARFVNKITNDGETIAQKYQDFVNGEYPDAKPYLIYAANTQLGLMGGSVSEDTLGTAIRVQPAPDAHADADGESEDKPRPKKPKITMKEILNWDIGRLIRQQTHDCRDLIVDLHGIMHPPSVFPSENKAEKKYQKATRVRPHHEFEAMKEIYKRGIGSQNPDCRVKTSYLEEKMLHSKLADDIRDITDGGLDIVPYLRYVIDNPKLDRWNNIIEDPYTQTHRLWAIKHLIWRGVDIPWEHITPDDIEEYFRNLDEKRRLEAERRRAERKTAAQLTPEQEAEIRALFEQTQRQAERAEAKAAAKAAKKAKKAAKKAAVAKKAELDTANNNTGNNNNDNGNAPASNNKATANGNNANSADAPPGATATPPLTNRGATAVANAIDRHPEVDLDTALENHHATAGIPKENLTYEQIYDAITAEANFQKRQSIIQRRLHPENPDAAPEDSDPAKSRSP